MGSSPTTRTSRKSSMHYYRYDFKCTKCGTEVTHQILNLTKERPRVIMCCKHCQICHDFSLPARSGSSVSGFKDPLQVRITKD